MLGTARLYGVGRGGRRYIDRGVWRKNCGERGGRCHAGHRQQQEEKISHATSSYQSKTEDLLTKKAADFSGFFSWRRHQQAMAADLVVELALVFNATRTGEAAFPIGLAHVVHTHLLAGLGGMDELVVAHI